MFIIILGVLTVGTKLCIIILFYKVMFDCRYIQIIFVTFVMLVNGLEVYCE